MLKHLQVAVLLGLSAIAITGCASDVEEPTLGHSVTFTLQDDAKKSLLAPTNGQMSVYDLNQNKVVFTGRVKRDQHVVIDPAGRRIMIDDTIAADQLQGGDQLQITFEEGM